jgi:hypothetical protein
VCCALRVHVSVVLSAGPRTHQAAPSLCGVCAAAVDCPAALAAPLAARPPVVYVVGLSQLFAADGYHSISDCACSLCDVLARRLREDIRLSYLCQHFWRVAQHCLQLALHMCAHDVVLDDVNDVSLEVLWLCVLDPSSRLGLCVLV